MSHHYYSDGHYSENNLQDHYEDVNPTVAVVLCSIALTLAILLCCTWFWTWVYVQDDWTVSWLVNDETACSLCTCLTLFFIAMCVLTAYSGQLRRRDEQDYYGKMRITNVTYEHRVETVEDGNEITDWEHFYEARYTLDWGYEWACPSMSLPSGYKECPASSLIACTHKICKKEHCKQSEIDEAVRATMECTLQSYDPMQNYTSYEPRQGPSQDVDWPHVVAYGDCETCSVYWSVASPEKLANERTAGLVLLGVTAAALCVVAWQVCGILKPSENDKPPMIVEEPDIEVVVTADINDFDKPLVPEAEIEVLPQCTKEEKIKCAECRVTKLRALFSPQQLQTNNPVCRNCAGVSRPPATNPDFVEPTQVGNEPSSKVMFACVSCGIEKPSKDFDPEQVGKPIPQCRLCTVNIEKSFDKTTWWKKRQNDVFRVALVESLNPMQLSIVLKSTHNLPSAAFVRVKSNRLRHLRWKQTAATTERKKLPSKRKPTTTAAFVARQSLHGNFLKISCPAITESIQNAKVVLPHRMFQQVNPK